MKNDFIDQFNHTWYLYEGIINDFDDISWLNLQHGYITPARLAFHILLSTLYYLQDDAVLDLPSGKTLHGDWLTIDEELLPLRSDILEILSLFRAKTNSWIFNLDINDENTAFPWAGKTKAGVILFLLRHTLYHIGELNALLFESKNGVAEDNFIKAFYK
jgi:hypothetical protein